ncbi:NADH dehydrogenase (quinone), G subunit [Neorickettsia helminthoeca str. Oregon]|uniref:NADH-quinone oxidoreductase n=1 Tax=Neorickettsia helminthoeca str. Oregon TaxID=1286528 RepID=X5HJ08_9RICK|nr:NADH-quinone oxidoreductase subunit NuoG [Neorickettsia helminthoeca]AHX11029.1 NADH dehydrogenase (quinone), G subunit [Neorickettsia helminthoeca str. Oregon]
MISVTINGKKLSVEPGYSVIQVCQMAGVEIPRFCYHERLKIAGNCRMCLVEIEGGPPKPIASCAMPVADGMVVHTDTPKIREAREGVMEFLLANHPLDCPICDQGGECDLQDQAMLYGKGVSRFPYQKRAVSRKDFGPLIATEMNRCILCSRCVRFLSDVAGVDELGMTGRGGDAEISTYIKKAISSEISGNIIDLCPVGALTSKPYAFTARSWELNKIDSVDVLDAVGSNIRVDVRGQSVMRILPRLNEEINEEWLSDKARFSYDGLRVQRLDRCYIRVNGKLEECTWDRALSEIVKRIDIVSREEIAAIAGNLIDVESAFLLKRMMDKLGVSKLECRQDGATYPVSDRSLYTFNSTISGIEKSDLCFLVGANLRVDAPLINARLRKRWLAGDYKVIGLGCGDVKHTFDVHDLGDSVSTLVDIKEGKHEDFLSLVGKSMNPMMIIGPDMLARPDASYVLFLLRSIAEQFSFIRDDCNNFSVLQRHSGTVGALDIGFHHQGGLSSVLCGDTKVVYLLGADECVDSIPEDAFVIYQGHHGDRGAGRADAILPGCSYVEKDAIYVNTEGRAQLAFRAIFPPGEAKDDREIIADLAQRLGVPFSKAGLPEIREKLRKLGPQFGHIGSAVKNSVTPYRFSGDSVFSSDKITLRRISFYMTDPISRASSTMAKCREEFDAFANNC